MNQTARREAFAYDVSLLRLGDYGWRGALTRVVPLALTTGALVAAGEADLLAWLLLAVPSLGVYLSATSARYQLTGHLPEEPLARWSAEVGEGTRGQVGVNPSGVLEGAGAVCLGVLGPWVLQGVGELPRLLVAVAAALWLASLSSAVLLDPAWYNPRASSPRALEVLRALGGPVCAVAFAAVTLPAPWSTEGRLLVLTLSGLLLLVQLRVRETDRLLGEGRLVRDQAEVDGRSAVCGVLHSHVGNPLIEVWRRVPRDDKDLVDSLTQLEWGYRESLWMDQAAGLSVEWPGVLVSRLQAIAGISGAKIRFDPPQEALHEDDRMMARQVLEDLAMNAARAGARHIDVVLSRRGATYRAEVTDDGPPFKDGTWLRPGGGLERLAMRLGRLAGGLNLQQGPDKTVRAWWTAAS